MVLAAAVVVQPVLAAPPEQDGDVTLEVTTTVDGDGSIAPGDTVRFDITVVNTGVITASNVVVQDDYDEAALSAIDAGATTTDKAGRDLLMRLAVAGFGFGGTFLFLNSCELLAAVIFSKILVIIEVSVMLWLSGNFEQVN